MRETLKIDYFMLMDTDTVVLVSIYLRELDYKIRINCGGGQKKNLFKLLETYFMLKGSQALEIDAIYSLYFCKIALEKESKDSEEILAKIMINCV